MPAGAIAVTPWTISSATFLLLALEHPEVALGCRAIRTRSGPVCRERSCVPPFARLSARRHGRKGARVVDCDDAYALVPLVHLQAGVLWRIHVADARDLVEPVRDVHQVLIDDGEWRLRPLDAQLLVQLGIADRRGAPDRYEDHRPAATVTGQVIEEGHEPLELKLVDLGGAGLEEQRDLPRALQVGQLLELGKRLLGRLVVFVLRGLELVEPPVLRLELPHGVVIGVDHLLGQRVSLFPRRGSGPSALGHAHLLLPGGPLHGQGLLRCRAASDQENEQDQAFDRCHAFTPCGLRLCGLPARACMISSFLRFASNVLRSWMTSAWPYSSRSGPHGCSLPSRNLGKCEWS